MFCTCVSFAASQPGIGIPGKFAAVPGQKVIEQENVVCWWERSASSSPDCDGQLCPPDDERDNESEASFSADWPIRRRMREILKTSENQLNNFGGQRDI